MKEPSRPQRSHNDHGSGEAKPTHHADRVYVIAYAQPQSKVELVRA